MFSAIGFLCYLIIEKILSKNCSPTINKEIYIVTERNDEGSSAMFYSQQ